MLDDIRPQAVTETATLREIVGQPTPQIANKEMQEIDGYFRRFLALCPFLCISSADAEGNQDVSPRGDPPGFVRMLDTRTVLIPDRKGNRRVDTMRNIIENPKVGLVLFLPGVEEVVRINGRATVTDDPALLAPSAIGDSVPPLGIVVAIDDIFFHCAKAIKALGPGDPDRPHRLSFVRPDRARPAQSRWRCRRDRGGSSAGIQGPAVLGRPRPSPVNPESPRSGRKTVGEVYILRVPDRQCFLNHCFLTFLGDGNVGMIIALFSSVDAFQYPS
jgi:uncharacterized protein